MVRLLAVLLAISSSATAADEAWPAFAKQGQVLPLGVFSITSATQGSRTITDIAIDPEILYFAADNFLLGVDAGYISHSGDSGFANRTGWGIGGHVGGGFNLGGRISLLILGTLAFLSSKSEAVILGTTYSDTRNSLALRISAPLLFQLAPHFFVGMGPFATYEVWGTVTSTGGVSPGSSDITKGHVLGLQSLIGGWF